MSSRFVLKKTFFVLRVTAVEEAVTMEDETEAYKMLIYKNLRVI